MNLSDMRTSLRRKIGNPGTTEVPNATLDEHLNNAYRDLATKFAHPKARKICSFPTVADSAAYGLPTAIGGILRVWDDTNKKRLEKIGDRRYAELPTMETGKPDRYVRLRDFIELIPTPDDAYTIFIHYTETIADLVQTDDVPVIPIPWHVGIVFLARWYYRDDQGDLPKASYALNAYNGWLSNRPTTFDEETVDIDSAVELPTLTYSEPRLDFDEAP